MGTKARTNKIDPAEYRRYLEGRLSQTRARIKMADAVTGITIVIVAWISYLLIAVMADQVVELSATIRFLLLSACLLVTGSILVVKVIIPSLKQINTRFAARSIESADQRMKNSVLSYVELSEHSAELPAPILRTIENKAASDLSRVRIEDAIQPRHILSALYFLAAVVVLFCLYSFFTTKSFGASIERVLLPLGATAPPTSTQMRIVFDPGATDPTEPTPIPADSSITFKASVIRGNPEQVMAYLQAEGSDYEEPHELARSENLKSEFTLTLHQRQKTFNVRFVANDFRSKPYKIVVTPAPMITDWLLRYTPPAYTGEESFTSTTPDITGLEGTKVAVEATTNLPIAASSGRIEFKLAKPTASVDMKLVEGADNRMVGEFTLSGDGSYTVLFSDREGRSPLFRPSNNIRVLKDLAPVVEFIQPAEKDSSLPANRPLPLVARVKDDYGLRGYTLTFRKRGSEESPIIFEQGNLPGVSLERNESINETVDLSRWKLVDGDVVEYWIEAEDNKLPASNMTDTRRDSRIVRITKPVEDQPLAKNDQPQNSSDEREQSPNGERKENEPSSEVALTEKDQGETNSTSSGREDAAKSGDGTASEKNDPDAAGNQPSNDELKRDGSEQQNGTEQDALRKEMQREKGSSDSNRPQTGENSKERSSDPTQGNELSSEDEKELEKLREYFQKKSGSSDDSKRKDGDASTKGSRDRDAMNSSNEQDSSKDPTNNLEEKPADRTENPSRKQSNDASTSQDSNAKEDQKETSGEKSTKDNPSNNAASAATPPDETAQQKNEEKPRESGDSNSNPNTPTQSKNKAESEKRSNETDEGKDRSSQKNQRPNGDEPSNPNHSMNEDSGAVNDEKNSGTKRDDSDFEKQNSLPSQENSNSTEKKADSANQKPKTEEQKSDATKKSPDSLREEDPKSSEPRTGRQANEPSQQKSSGNNPENSSKESGNESSSKENSPKTSENGTPQNSPEQNGDRNEQQKSDGENQTRAGSEAKPNANGESKPSQGEKKTGQESQSQSGDSGNSSKSSEEGKQNKESREGKPTSASDDDSDQAPNRSTKMGNNESSAASKGNSEGSSQEGPSQSPGQKGPGSPSDQKGNESKGQGNEQRTRGKSGSSSSEQSSKSGEGQKSSQSPSNESMGEQSSDERSETQNSSSSKEGDSSSSSPKNESSNERNSPSSNGKQPQTNSSDSHSKEESKDQSSGRSSNSSEDSSPMNDKQSPQEKNSNEQKQDAKNSDSGSSGSKEDQKQGQQSSTKGSSSSGDQQSGKPSPSENSNPGGVNDAQSPSPTNRPQGGNKPNPTSNTKGEGTPIDNTGDAADQEDLKKGSNLILKKLEDQLANKKVDPELLKSMGWTEEDARKFYERMKTERPADNVSPLGQEQRRRFGQGTDLRKSTGKSAGKTNDAIQDLYSGKRTPVPPQVRKRFEAYMKSLSETSGGKAIEKTSPPPAGTK